MSSQEFKTIAAPTPDAQPGLRLPLLIGAAVALLVAALGILSLGGSATAAGATGGRASALALAPAAFLAGVFSFLSPCTLPILPAYFAFTFQARRERVVLMTVAFFLGLATTMVIVGASASALSWLVASRQREITLAGGLLVIGFGIASILGKGFSGVKLLDRPTASLAGSYLYGATFAFGWTACIGPILGALLTMLATQGVAVVQGAVLAFIYALGLGTPLIAVAAFYSRLGSGSRLWRIMRGRGFSVDLGFTTLHLHSTSVASGLLLIVMGVLLATGQLTAITLWAQRTPMAQWAYQLEQSLHSVLFGP